MVSVVIVAAGESKRFKSPILKPYFLLGDKPIIVHTLLAFAKERLVDEIILVIHPKEEEQTRRILTEFSIKVDKVVTGGERRQDSVACGLKEVSPQSQIVLVHDGVRPLVDKKLIEEVIKETRLSGAVVPAIPCEDTIKEVKKEKVVVKTFNRHSLWAVQTPQGFKKDLLFSAYEKAKTLQYYGTDDAELVEHLGHQVKVIYGAKENIKITMPVDLVFAEAILKKRLTGE